MFDFLVIFTCISVYNKTMGLAEALPESGNKTLYIYNDKVQHNFSTYSMYIKDIAQTHVFSFSEKFNELDAFAITYNNNMRNVIIKEPSHTGIIYSPGTMSIIKNIFNNATDVIICQ
jgi:hypothetical protein